MRVTADNGRGVEVKDGGRGIPLLLVHGFPLSSEIFADMRPLVEQVGRVVALDLPGFGSSDAPESGYTMDELAAEVMRVANHLDLDLPALVVVGAEDELTPVTEARELSEALPRGRLQVISEAGHTSPLENPEVFGDAVAVFLRELD